MPVFKHSWSSSLSWKADFMYQTAIRREPEITAMLEVRFQFLENPYLILSD